MIATLRQVTDRLLGRGSAAITVPVMDGTLRPNRWLDEATVVAERAGLDDLAVADGTLWASADGELCALGPSGLETRQRFEAPITAFAWAMDGRLAVALAGREIRVLDSDWHLLHRITTLADQPLVAVNAISWGEGGRLFFTDGSREHAPPDWTRDLMKLGRSGRVGGWLPDTEDAAALLADGLAHAYGVLPLPGTDGAVLVSESWQHRVIRVGGTSAARRQPLVADLPAYPSRLTPASDGGYWLTCFACRTQLVEFVLREHAYRTRMLAEIAPAHWIAPALSSGRSFLEPLQGAGVKNMGVLKPWAPPRSYGLLIHVAPDGRLQRALHSQVDGHHHGVTAVQELNGALYVLAKGAGRLLRVDLAALEDHA